MRLLTSVRLLADKLFDERLESVVLMGRNGGRTADDKRGAGLIDKNGVDLVDDGIVMAALNLLLAAGRHAVVAKVVEAELAVRPVGNVALVLGAALLGRLVVLDDPGGEAEEAVELAHPFGVTPGEIVVNGDDMNAPPGEGVEIDW